MLPFSAPLKASGNFTAFWYFQEVEKKYLGKEWVKYVYVSRNSSCEGSYAPFRLYSQKKSFSYDVIFY